MKIYEHIPHPHLESRKMRIPKPKAIADGRLARINMHVGDKVTQGVGTMWCAYAFAIIAFISLPEAIHTGTSALISWIAQTFLQLVLLSIIMVGQKVASAAGDARAANTYQDVEILLHEMDGIKKHLSAQDTLLQEIKGACNTELKS